MFAPFVGMRAGPGGDDSGRSGERRNEFMIYENLVLGEGKKT